MRATDDEYSLWRKYLLSLLRSRRAVGRILRCVADLAERDEACARTLAEHPELLASLLHSMEDTAGVILQQTASSRKFGSGMSGIPYTVDAVRLPHATKYKRRRSRKP